MINEKVLAESQPYELQTREHTRNAVTVFKVILQVLTALLVALIALATVIIPLKPVQNFFETCQDKWYGLDNPQA